MVPWRPWRAVTETRRKNWAVTLAAGALALAGLVGGSFGNVHSQKPHAELEAWTGAAVLLVFGVVATGRIAAGLGRRATTGTFPTAGGAVRILTAVVGYLFVLFGVLAVVDVSVTHLLVGAGLAGVVLGIAAQQSLGNVFAGLVLLLSRPFAVGERIRIRSGALGGIFDARVEEMSLTYVTLSTDEGLLKVPNAAMLAAGILRLRPGIPPLPPASTPLPAAPTSTEEPDGDGSRAPGA